MKPALPFAAGLLIFGTLVSMHAAGQDTSQLSGQQRQFEVVAIKQSSPDQSGSSWSGHSDRITVHNYTLRHLIRVAYDLKSDKQILGGPDWIDKSHFDLAAKLEDADVASIYKLPYLESQHQIQLMLQNMLSERFQLRLKQEQRMLPVYSLEVAKSGAKITSIPEPKDPLEAKSRGHGMSTGNGNLTAKAISMDKFADYLTEWTESGDRVVLNHTQLNGDFDFTLNWTQDRGSGIPADAPLPGLFTAIQQQLGLVLKSDKSAVPVVVIEAASLPQFD